MAKTDAQIVREVLDRMRNQSNEAKAREITKVLGKRIRQRARGRGDVNHAAVGIPTPGNGRVRNPAPPQGRAQRYAPIDIKGEPLSLTILRDRGTY